MRQRAPRLFASAAALALLAAPAPAALAADEGSAFDQYIENVPGSSGEKPSRDVVIGDGAPLSPAASRALEALGPAGARVARVAELVTPKPGHGGEGKAAPDKDESGLGAAIGELFDFDAGGIGFVFPLALAGTLIAGIAFALSRRFGRQATP